MSIYLCEVEQEGNKSHVVWKCANGNVGYKLIEIAKANGFMNDLPGDERVFGFEELIERNNNIVFSEYSAGRMDFIYSYQKILTKQSYHWLCINADSWDKAAFECSKDFDTEMVFDPAIDFVDYAALNAASSNKKIALAHLLTIVDNLGDEKIGLGEKINALKNWLKNNKHLNIALIFRDISTLGIKLATEIAAVFRQIFDDNSKIINLSILILDTSSLAFLDAAETSGYAPLCYQYRLPFLCREEIEKLMVCLFGPLRTIDGFDVLESIYEHTGGQLLLVQDCLRRISLGEDNVITPGRTNKAIKLMHNNPPSVVKKWQEELKLILQRNPELIISMKAYVGGHSLSAERFPPPSQELSLFLAGWLKVNQLGRWGITSALHASLANLVLDDLAKGASHG